MQLHNVFLAAASLAVGVMAQEPSYRDCTEYEGGLGQGYICNWDLKKVEYCQPHLSPPIVVSQYCPQIDCTSNRGSGFCLSGASPENAGHGPSDCSQVLNKYYACSPDYSAITVCKNGVAYHKESCDSNDCWASTTGDRARCVNKNQGPDHYYGNES